MASLAAVTPHLLSHLSHTPQHLQSEYFYFGFSPYIWISLLSALGLQRPLASFYFLCGDVVFTPLAGKPWVVMGSGGYAVAFMLQYLWVLGAMVLLLKSISSSVEKHLAVWLGC